MKNTQQPRPKMAKPLQKACKDAVEETKNLCELPKQVESDPTKQETGNEYHSPRETVAPQRFQIDEVDEADRELILSVVNNIRNSHFPGEYHQDEPDDEH